MDEHGSMATGTTMTAERGSEKSSTMTPFREAEVALNDQIERLERLAVSIVEKVGPVLRPAPETSGDLVAHDPGETSTLTSTLRNWSARVSSVNERIGYAIDRCEL